MNKLNEKKEGRCYASCSDCYHEDRENFFSCKEMSIHVKRRILEGK